MQGNSKYLRWSPLYTCCCVFVILSSTVIAVPVRPRRMVRETFSFDTVNSNTISNATCLRDGVEVQKSSVKCEIKTGCKLIQKTGECCPDYQCDCNHEDRTYENGEKIVSHDPCRRCVCKGGEVTCNEVSCYIRDDCKPRYAKGICCPQYDNCPPIDDVKITAAKETTTKSSKNDVIISVATTTVSSQKEDKNPLLQLANENPLGIKIKEITKPEEIRITDDKPKPFNPFKSTTTTTTPSPTTTTTITTTETSTLESTTKLSTESTSLSDGISTETPSKDTTTEDNNQPSTTESHDYMDDGPALSENSSGPPPTKASANGEVEPEVLLVSADSNSIGDDSGNKSVRQTTENSTSAEDQSPDIYDSSSTTEGGVYESSTAASDLSSTRNVEWVDLSDQPTPKNIVVVRQGGKTESFHISGTDGLQRVEEFDVLSSTTDGSQDEVSESATPDQSLELMPSAENKSSEEVSTETSSTAGSMEVFEETVTATLKIEKHLDNTLETNDNSTEQVGNSSSEATTPGDSSSESPVSEEIYETIYYPEEKTTASPSSEEAIDTVYYSSTQGIFDASSTTESSDFSSEAGSTRGPDVGVSEEADHMSTTASPATERSTSPSPESIDRRYPSEEEDITPPENPEFPYIPDDVSNTALHNKEIEEERRLPSKSDENVSSTAGPCSDCAIVKVIESSTTQGPPLEEVKMSHKLDKIESRAPGEPLLIPEWERTTVQKATIEELTTLGPKEATTTTNVINKTAVLDNAVEATMIVSNTNKSSALIAETLPNDVSSEEKYGRKEPTTEWPTTKGYANLDDNEEGSASSIQAEFDSSTVEGASPKDDAESIKLNSSAVDEEETNNSYVEGRSYAVNPFESYWKHVFGQSN